VRFQAPLQAGRSAGSEIMIICQTAAEELEDLTLSVLLLYSTQEFIRAEQREDDQPITHTTAAHTHCGSLVRVSACAHPHLCFTAVSVLSVLMEIFLFSGVSASVSLVIDPSRSQHFSSQSLSLSCVDQSNSAGWTVRRYTDTHTQTCAKQTGSGCVIDSLSTSDSGVYWCESESGEKRRPRNITVHGESGLIMTSTSLIV